MAIRHRFDLIQSALDWKAYNGCLILGPIFTGHLQICRLNTGKSVWQGADPSGVAWPCAMSCSAECPNCRHEFQCCPQTARCCRAPRRSLHSLSGGGLVLPTPQPPPITAPITPTGGGPQVSPSMPLAFVLPPPFTLPALRIGGPLNPAPEKPISPAPVKPETELARLQDTVRALRLSGWYHEGLHHQQAHERLKSCSVGTFLLRNSSDHRYLFSLSVQTGSRGPTSVRLVYLSGFFRLDAQLHLQSTMPFFSSVIDLIQYYVEQSRLCQDSNSQVWMDPQGKIFSSILLTRPLRKETGPADLKHLSRLAVHKALQAGKPRIVGLPAEYTKLELPTALANYLGDYPYTV